MAHTFSLIKNFYPEYKDCKLAAISPCFGKRHEFDENGLGDFNVTMSSLSAYFKKNKIDLSKFPKLEYDNPSAERAVLYSTPGGLLRATERIMPGISAVSRKIEGHPAVLDYLSELAESVKKGKPAYKLIDCLSCAKGCNCGAGTVNHGLPLDDLENFIERRSEERQRKLKTDSAAGRRKLEKTIEAYWREGIYPRSYVDRSGVFQAAMKIPSESQLDEIYHKMGNLRESEDSVNKIAQNLQSEMGRVMTAIQNLSGSEE
ncbi:MAG: hypothetical protein IIU46_10340 [Treponema sp.]|nr:hypothetical protein [Treponema sp.]